MIKLIEVKSSKSYNPSSKSGEIQFSLDEVWINPDSVLQIKEDTTMKNNLIEGFMPADLDDRQQFSRIIYGSGTSLNTIVVVGPPPEVAEKVYKTSSRQLLKG